MNNRNTRFDILRKIPTFARLDHRKFLNKAGKPFFLEGMSRKERRKLNAETKKIASQYEIILKEFYNSGVGFPVDQTIRNMAAEYTNRFASSGTELMPVSFNYFEAFCDIQLIKNSIAPFMSLAPEINHLFNISDFFDFLTSSDSEQFVAEDLLNIPEAQTMHFTNNGNLGDLTFFDASGREYILSGFSMVRRGCSVHWFLVAGEKLSQEEWELRIQDTHEVNIDDVPPWKRAFMQEIMDRSGSTTGPPMKLEGTETAIRTLVAGEFDASAKKHIGKCIFIETENSFAVFSDDPDVLISVESPVQTQQIIDGAMQRVRQADVLWNVAEGLFQLPQYFETRVTVPRSVIQRNGKPMGLKGKGGRGATANYVAVEAVAIEETEAPSTIRRISMPLYSTETGGHWRRLNLSQEGKDRDGNPVSGKTWVTRPNHWRDDKNRSPIVYVKDCLSIAKSQIEKLYATVGEQGSKSQVNDSGNGELYVLRCPLMQEELYKIGWTSGTAIERAKQLSSATGVPLAFVVVESWAHSDPEALETEVHAQLSPYRQNNQREFFQLNFKHIREIIVRTIERVSTANSNI